MKVYFVLDRSGSMAGRWTNTIMALQEFVSGLKAKDKISLLAFDTSFSMAYEMEKQEKLRLSGVLNGKKIAPRGATALFDAIARMNEHIFKTHKEGKKAMVVILTDGYENASKDNTKEHVQGIIESWKKRGIDVSFIGSDFDNFAEGRTMGVNFADTMTVASHKTGAVAQALSGKAARYRAGEDTAFTTEEREKTRH